MAINRERFQNLIRATREAAPARFDITKYAHACGSPACVLGNYAARDDLQSAFTLAPDSRFGMGVKHIESGHTVVYDDKVIADHFGITIEDAEKLFSAEGCSDETFVNDEDEEIPVGAQTPAEACDYLEKFLADCIEYEDNAAG